MRKIIIGAMIICFMVIISGCAGLSDYSIKLPNNYWLIRANSLSITIYKTKDGTYDGIADYSGKDIPTTIEKIDFDNRYVIAKQYETIIVDPLGDNCIQKKSKHQKNMYYTTCYDEKGNVLEDHIDRSKANYWILDTLNDKLYGPYNNVEDYKKEKKELGIEKLQLKSLNKFNHIKEY